RAPPRTPSAPHPPPRPPPQRPPPHALPPAPPQTPRQTYRSGSVPRLAVLHAFPPTSCLCKDSIPAGRDACEELLTTDITDDTDERSNGFAIICEISRISGRYFAGSLPAFLRPREGFDHVPSTIILCNHIL